MSPKRIKQRLEDFTKALERLKEVLAENGGVNNGMIIDATIKRFEFTFELAWKLGKDVLDFSGIEIGVNTPRSIIKELYKAEIIQDGETWIRMLENRNKTSHIYDEHQAQAIYEEIKKRYYGLFEEFKQKILSMTADIK